MVHFIDTASREVVDNLLVGSRPRFSEFKSDGSELWVTSEIGGSLAIIDPATRKLKQTVTFEIPGLRSESIQPVGSFRAATLSAGQVSDPQSLLAVTLNGHILPWDHGYPARTIIPNAPGVHNTKWVNKITFLRQV